MALNETLIWRIRSELEAQGISARALARRMNVSQTYLQDRLTGRREFRSSDVEAVAGALGVEPSHFFDNDEPAVTPNH